MSELSDEASETELLNRSLTIGEKDLDQKNRGGWTPLMYASYIGYDTVVRMLLQAGANVNMSTPEGQTPLMLAASCGNECAAAFLLQQGAELEMKDIHGWTALFHCTSAGHQQMVKFLLDSGANGTLLWILPSDGSSGFWSRDHRPVSSQPFTNVSSCYAFIFAGEMGVKGAVFPQGVKVDVRDSTGATARTLAMKCGHMKIVGLIDLHTAPVPKVLRRGAGKYEDLSSSDESYCAPQRQRPARKSRGPSIHEGPHALAKITAVRTGGKTQLHHEQIPPEGYVTFKDDGYGLEGGGLRYRDVISPINDRDVESSSSREENSFFTNDVGVIRTSSSSEGLARNVGLSSEGSLESNEDSDSAAKSSSRKHAKGSMKAKNRYGNNIDLRIFLTLTESDLKEIGITLFGPKRKMTSAIARWHSSAQPLSDALELAYADRLEAEMQELAIQLHKRCEEVKGLKGQVSQEQELRAVVESCLMEQDVAWSNAQTQLQEVQGITRSAGILLEQMRTGAHSVMARIRKAECSGPEGWSPTLKALSLPELSALLEECVGEMGK
ncbi:Ankyrin repeat and SAM domain-containing protein 3, partial [Ophiophagus hannah]